MSNIEIVLRLFFSVVCSAAITSLVEADKFLTCLFQYNPIKLQKIVLVLVGFVKVNVRCL